MPRSNEASYKNVAMYLQQRKGIPATINDMVAANITSRATLYRLFRPEMFSEMALYGIKPLNNSKPFFFTYDSELQMEILTKVDSTASDLVATHKDVMVNAANKVAANAFVPDAIESQVLGALRKFREAYDKDEVLVANFSQDAAPVGSYLDTMVSIREILEAEPIKFMSYILSTFVTQSKEL